MLLDSLRRGVVSGSVAGVAYGALLALVINPLVTHVEHGGHDHGHGAEPVVSEATTAAASVGGGVLWGVLLGAAFGVAFYLLEPSLPGAGSTRAYALAAAGFLTVSGVPWLALPPVAPGAEQALPTDVRTAVYAGAMALGAIVCALSIVGYRRVASDRGRSAAVVAAVAPFALCVIPLVVAPTNAVGGGPPAELATAFRWLTVFGQIAVWALIAATYGRLERRERNESNSPVKHLEDELRPSST